MLAGTAMPSSMGTRALAQPSSAPLEAAQRCMLRSRTHLCGSTVQHRWRCWERCEGLTERRTHPSLSASTALLMQGPEHHRHRQSRLLSAAQLTQEGGPAGQQAFLPAGDASVTTSAPSAGDMVALRAAGTGLASC